MRRLLLIANPSASSFTGALHRDVMEILSRSFAVTRIWPDGPAETRKMAARAAGEGFVVVAAMGGDGVVHHAVNGIAGTATALGIVPAGTTNVLARILGLPENPRKAAAGLASWSPRPVPLLQIEAVIHGTPRSELATFAAGIGFDAAVVARAERTPLRKNFFGGIHYARNAARVLATDYWFRRAHLDVECDGTRHDAVTVLASVHWPFTFFGRIPLRLTQAPVGRPSAAVFTRFPRLRSPELALRAMTGRNLPKAGGVQVVTGFEEIIITADPGAMLQADGELLGSASAVTLRPVPDGIEVLAPPETG